MIAGQYLHRICTFPPPASQDYTVTLRGVTRVVHIPINSTCLFGLRIAELFRSHSLLETRILSVLDCSLICSALSVRVSVWLSL